MEINLAEIVHQELDLDPEPDPFSLLRIRIGMNMFRIHNTAA